MGATATLPDRPDFRRRETIYRDGWTGDTRTARYTGRCVLCGVRTYTDSGGNDPRGPMGEHAAAPLDPTEYGATGATVPACFTCQNDTEERYHRLLRRAERVGDWRYTEPATSAGEECQRCGSPIRLRGGDWAAYAGWEHTGAATFHVPTLDEEAAARAAGIRPSYAPTGTDDHEAYPRRDARVGCRNRAHHFSGSWCQTCGGWA